jgi:two-component system chemotaxis sensor kinase CheA
MPLDPEYQELYELFADEARQTLENFLGALLELEKRFRQGIPIHLGQLSDHLRPLHTLKGNAGMIGLERFSKVIHHLEAEIKEGKVLDLKGLDLRLRTVEQLISALPLARKGEEPKELLGLLEALEEGREILKEKKGKGGRKRKGVEAPQGVSGPARALDTSPSQGATRGEGEGEEFVRVRGERLDELQSDVAELILSFGALGDRLGRIISLLDREESREIRDLIERLEGRLRRIREHTVHLRLTPLTRVLRRAPLIVRDSAQRAGKDVEVVLTGESTEADKSVVELVEEVLVHLLRNAVDHGIEPPGERVAKGKPKAGRIRVWAKSLGEEIEIGVEDDGRGISEEQVRERAVALGIVSAEEASKVDRSELLRWIFLPGFTTREEVSELSGRGVGLDAVLHRVQSLGGRVEVDSRQGLGTTFRLFIPTSTQLSDLLLACAVSQLCIAFPLHRILAITRYDPERVRRPGGVERYLHNREWIPLVDLARWLWKKEEERRYMVVFDTEPHFALPLRSLEGKIQGVVRTLEEPLLRDGPFYAVTILGRGGVAPVLDPEQTLHRYRLGEKEGSRV